MTILGCVSFMAGMLLCQPGDRFIEVPVPGDTPHMFVETRNMLTEASDQHKSIWGDLTIEKIDAAFADWGPRRHIPIDWSKVRGVKAP